MLITFEISSTLMLFIIFIVLVVMMMNVMFVEAYKIPCLLKYVHVSNIPLDHSLPGSSYYSASPSKTTDPLELDGGFTFFSVYE